MQRVYIEYLGPLVAPPASAFEVLAVEWGAESMSAVEGVAEAA